MPRRTIHTLIYWFCAIVFASILLAGCSTPAIARQGTTPDSVIAGMMAQVQSSILIDRVKQLSGNTPAQIGGESYTITTRETESGVPIAKATQFAYEFLAARGLAVSYHNWSECDIANRNVVGEKIGVELPGEIVLVTAHLDSTSEGGVAPGADDDASGSVAVLTLAEILAPYQFQRTLRFVLFTGEEQGLCGSEVYARQAAGANVNIVAVYNMDMIAWDSDSEPIVRLHTRTTNHPGYAADLAIANTFISVVEQYGLGEALTPIVAPDAVDQSDTFSFWDNGYAGILAIEDDDDVTGDFNPYYHSTADRVSALNPTYFANFVKAGVGTAALLAGLVQTSAGTPTATPTQAPTPTATPTAKFTPKARVFIPAVNR